MIIRKGGRIRTMAKMGNPKMCRLIFFRLIFTDFEPKNITRILAEKDACRLHGKSPQNYNRISWLDVFGQWSDSPQNQFLRVFL
jgi:hypothetical protein